MSDQPFLVDLRRYPQLRHLCWSRPGAQTLEGHEALALYESNWRFVDQGALTEEETRLIEDLAQRFGGGVLLT